LQAAATSDRIPRLRIRSRQAQEERNAPPGKRPNLALAPIKLFRIAFQL